MGDIGPNAVSAELRVVVNGKERIFRTDAATLGDPGAIITGIVQGVKDQALNETDLRPWWKDPAEGAPAGVRGGGWR